MSAAKGILLPLPCVSNHHYGSLPTAKHGFLRAIRTQLRKIAEMLVRTTMQRFD